MADLFPMILLASATSLVLAPFILRISRRVGLVDVPGSAPHKRHIAATPQAGGLLLLTAIMLTYAVLRPPMDLPVLGILGGGALVVLWGLLDDRYGLRPVLKLAGQLLATAMLIAAGVQVHITQNPVFDLPITLVWVVGLINAFNFVDSMDGLALGLASIAAAFFTLVTVDSVQPVLSALSATILGAALGGFFFNAAPARLFLGDSGSQLLGFLLAGLGIAYVPGQAGLPQGVSWFTPILVLGVPIFDMTLVVTTRLWRRRPVYRANRDHTYHRLLALGLDSTRSVLLMQVTAVMLGLVAFIALDATVLIANVMFGAIVIGGLAALVVLERAPEPPQTKEPMPAAAEKEPVRR